MSSSWVDESLHTWEQEARHRINSFNNAAIPDKRHQVVGAMYNPGQHRNAQFALGRGQGLAASAAPVRAAPLSTDKQHEQVLDGHAGSLLAGHPDGLFALNNAATSNHSLDANLSASRFRARIFGARSTRLEADGKVSEARLGAVDKLRAFVTAALNAGELQPDRVVHEEYIAPAADVYGGSFSVPQTVAIGVGLLSVVGMMKV